MRYHHNYFLVLLFTALLCTTNIFSMEWSNLQDIKDTTSEDQPVGSTTLEAPSREKVSESSSESKNPTVYPIMTQQPPTIERRFEIDDLYLYPKNQTAFLHAIENSEDDIVNQFLSDKEFMETVPDDLLTAALEINNQRAQKNKTLEKAITKYQKWRGLQ